MAVFLGNIFLKKWVWYVYAEIDAECRLMQNRLTLIPNPKNKKAKSSYVFFLIALFILRPINPSRSESVKLAGWDKKRIFLATSFQGNLPFVYGQVSSFIYASEGESTQIKEHPSWEVLINIHIWTFFFIRFHSSTIIYTRLVSRLHSSTFV